MYQEKISFLGISRHYMSLNAKLLDIGLFDTMVEITPPNKEARYALIKELLAPEQFLAKEILLQKMAQMSEYFTAKDLAVCFKEVQEAMSHDGEDFEKVFDQKVMAYKAACFPQT